MKLLRKDERELFESLIQYYKDDPVVQSMKKYIQHGDTSTYDHCLKVAEICFWLSKRMHLNTNQKALISMAMLHDFYMYDWHEKSKTHRWHGFRHPYKAAKNAKEYFNLSENECKAIESHMWPLTITKFPSSKEAWMLCIADKYCALLEIVS